MPPPLGHPHIAIVPYYLSGKSKWFAENEDRPIATAPRPPTGDWWRKRGAEFFHLEFLKILSLLTADPK